MGPAEFLEPVDTVAVKGYAKNFSFPIGGETIMKSAEFVTSEADTFKYRGFHFLMVGRVEFIPTPGVYCKSAANAANHLRDWRRLGLTVNSCSTVIDVLCHKKFLRWGQIRGTAWDGAAELSSYMPFVGWREGEAFARGHGGCCSIVVVSGRLVWCFFGKCTNFYEFLWMRLKFCLMLGVGSFLQW